MQLKSRILTSFILLTLASVAQPNYDFEILRQSGESAPRPRSVFFFAQQNNNHHSPAAFIEMLRKPFGLRDIQFTTRTLTSDLNPAMLSPHDAVFFGGNYNFVPETNQNAILDFAQDGGGIVGMHVVAFSFRGIPPLRNLIGGSFRGHHAFKSFNQELIQSESLIPSMLESHPDFPFSDGQTYDFDFDHPIIDGLETYTSVDEPYLHNFMSPDITLLGYRVNFGSSPTATWSEPYTWVRNEGQGRVFYHANGHDERTWSQPNFQELMIRGIHWASKSETGQTFTKFESPIVAPNGDLQFVSAVSKGGTVRQALYSGTYQSVIDGGQIPGPDESLRIEIPPGMDSVLVNDQVAFTPLLISSESPAGQPALLVGARNYPEILASALAPADSFQAGFRYVAGQDYPFQLNTSGILLFNAAIEDSAGGNQKSGFAVTSLADNSTQLALLEGDPFPDDLSTPVGSIDSSTFALSQEGNLTLLATKGNDPTTSYLLAGPQESLLTLSATNRSLPGLAEDAQISQFQNVGALRGGSVLTKIRLSGPNITSDNDQAIVSFRQTGGSDIRLLEGSLIADQVITFPPDGAFIERERGTLVEMTIEGSPALLRLPTNGSGRLALRVGQQVTSGGMPWLVSSFDSSSITTNGQDVIVPCRIRSSTDPETVKNSLILVNSSGPRIVSMEGWMLPTVGELFEIATISCSSGNQTVSGVNSSGRLVFEVTSTTGQSAIVSIADLQDLDQDGLHDTLEIAFGGNPDDGKATLPEGYPSATTLADGSFSLTFWRPVASGPELEMRAEMSTDLLTWDPYLEDLITSPDQAGVAPGFERTTLIMSAERGDTPTFFRLRAVPSR